MKSPGTRVGIGRRVSLATTGVVLSIAALTSCSEQTAEGGGSQADTVPAAGPLATSLDTAQGSWATVAMGHLGDPANTFWQLFFDPVGSGSWSDQIRGTAVATNGGVVMAADADGALLAGVRPFGFLTFSPLVRTADGGRSWSDAVLSGGLADQPASLATGPGGGVLGLVGGPSGARIVESGNGLGPWRTLETVRALAANVAARRCRLEAATAVSYLQASAVVGGRCRRSGVSPVFVRRSSGWELAGPQFPGLRGGRASVVSLRESGATLVALLSVTRDTGTDLVAAWTTGAKQWTCSPPLRLTAAEKLASVGPGTGAGLFALLDDASGRRRLAEIAPGAGWRTLPSPPAGSATVAFTGSGIDALTVNKTTLTVWALDHATSWTKAQTVHVDIQYGSSS